MRHEVDLTQDPDSVSAARRALADAAGTIDARRMEDARLLVSELVTNAIRHAALRPGDRISLVVAVSGAALRVEVSDPGQGFEYAEPAPDPTRPSGWGLYLVAELADRWGVEREAGTRVWFELDSPHRAPAAAAGA
jgi:anti-sigma regulatory factor (Ser/Thr protein kinase)